ncbi:hypothetical protein F3J45_00585 [Pantoea sp. Ap-967]|uniref:TorF family putative porin n=1 Tax=Pantoea sp. Ap-967 TaxID=2608362 RepID=UPI00142302B0|nr:TorF family putative porin [Pantoea sp. Ap-967]NIE72962.1 hypothetical protein [Pantoea sp. Ap-967]
MIFRVAMLSAAACSVSANAVELSENVRLDLGLGVVSDYRSNGVSQSRNNPSYQVEAVLSHSSGLFIGGSMQRADYGKYFDVYREDFYFAGYSHAFSEDVSLSAYLGRYEYRHDSAWDATEFYAWANIKKWTIGYIYDYEIDNHVPNLMGFNVGYNFSLPWEVQLVTTYGVMDLNSDFYTHAGHSRQRYNYYDAKFTRNLAGLEFSVDFTGSDLSKGECEYLYATDNVCSSTVTVGVKKHF